MPAVVFVGSLTDVPVSRTVPEPARGYVRLMRIGTRRDQGHLLRVLAEHEALVDALEQRDEKAALKALEQHLHRSEYVLAPKR